MVFRFKCFEFLLPETETDNTHDGQTNSPSSHGGFRSSKTISSSAGSYYTAKSDFGVSISEWPNGLLVFTYRELEQATGNFSPSSKIGEGDFGSIYKAVIQSPHEQLHVMVKRINERYTQGHKEWAKEANDIGAINHPNLIKLIGYCAEDYGSRFHRLLVYEYFPKGSLRDHLSAKVGASLQWALRLAIAHDAAFCLAYLHAAGKFKFGNFESSNVFLDGDGNAKLFYSSIDWSCLSEGLLDGSTAAIEKTGKRDATSMSDVWSYGVFLCELIMGKCPFVPKNEQNIMEWVQPCLNSRKLVQMVDSGLAGHYSLQSVKKLSKIAKRCLANNPKARPTMVKVMFMVNRVRLETTIDDRGQRRFADRKCRDFGCLTQFCPSRGPHESN